MPTPTPSRPTSPVMPAMPSDRPPPKRSPEERSESGELGFPGLGLPASSGLRLAACLLATLLLAWMGLAQAWSWGGRPAEPASVQLAQLPPEARQTLTLIKRGGPFPYAKDASVFGNREGLLPRQARGYYREYTVPTPGARDRGARRIVAGRGGDYWYTADHYRSFQRIRE